MEKPSSDSSNAAAGDDAGADSAAGTGSAAPSQAGAEAAPQYGLKTQGENLRKAKIGDKLAVGIDGLPGAVANLKVEPAEGSPSFEDQGWMIVPSTDPAVAFYAVPVKAGKRDLSDVVLSTTGSDGAPQVIGRAKGFSVEVESSLKEGEKPPPDILPPVGMPFPWVPVALGALAALIAVAAGIWIWRKFGRKKAPPAPSVPVFVKRPEDEVALEKLERLERESVWKRGEFKRHYFSVSELLKEYFGGRYGFDAQECTSHELELGLEKSGFSTERLRDVRMLFDRLDRVKFTDHVPAGDEPAEILIQARELVLATRRPRPVVTPILPERSEPSAF